MTIYDVDGVRYIRQDGDPVNQSGFIFIDEYCLLMLFVNGSDTDAFYAMEDSIKAI